MWEVVKKREISERIVELKVKAPEASEKAKPGQFAILRLSERGERFPMFIAGVDGGNLEFLIWKGGKSTCLLSALDEGMAFKDLSAPLGKALSFKTSKLTVICEGDGIAPARFLLRKKQNFADSINVIFLKEEEFSIFKSEFSDYTERQVFALAEEAHNFVEGETALLLTSVKSGALLFEKLVGMGVDVYVSLKSAIFCGFGICGSCRVSVDGKIRKACVEGPIFKAKEIDFKELESRLSFERDYEKLSLELFKSKISSCGE